MQNPIKTNENADFMKVATDIAVFNIVAGKLCLLLVKRDTPPYKGSRCLPGGFVRPKETVLQTAQRVLYEEAHLLCDFLEQLGAFSEIDRDPRRRAIGVGFYAIINDENILPHPGKEQQTAVFMPINKVPSLVFYHSIVRQTAYRKLQTELQYTDSIRYFLPAYFTMSQLQHHCEIILGRTFEKRNFAKYAHATYKLKRTNKKQHDVSHRPAWLYKFI